MILFPNITGSLCAVVFDGDVIFHFWKKNALPDPPLTFAAQYAGQSILLAVCAMILYPTTFRGPLMKTQEEENWLCIYICAIHTGRAIVTYDELTMLLLLSSLGVWLST